MGLGTLPSTVRLLSLTLFDTAVPLPPMLQTPTPPPTPPVIQNYNNL